MIADLSIFFATLTEIFGDFKFKDFARFGGATNFAQGLLGYAGVIFFLIKSLKTANILYVNGMWDAISGIVESLAAYFILGERFNSPWQYVGLALIFGGIFILRSGGVSY